jgi:formylglycine-generating enzyme required for sulfatase activity
MAVSVGAAGLIFKAEIEFWLMLLMNFDRLPINVQGCREYRHRETGIVFVRLPDGRARTGGLENERGRGYQQAADQQVTVRGFLIAKYEVTVGEWERVMGSRAPNEKTGQNYPVTNVSWEETQGFCSRNRLTLPTEAQWEYACRANSTGADAGRGNLLEMGWSLDNSGTVECDSEGIWKDSIEKFNQLLEKSRSHPVGQKRPNGWGLYDMHGNVWEWCDGGYEGGMSRVVRGGSHYDQPWNCQATARMVVESGRAEGHIGFRPVFGL